MDLLRISKRYDRPVYVYSKKTMTEQYKKLERAFPPPFQLSYSVKANSHQKVVQHFAQLKARADVSSLKEYEIAKKAGISAKKISFSGPSKGEKELRFLIKEGAQICIESFDELEQVKSLSKHKTASVFLRVNPLFSINKKGEWVKSQASQFGIDEEQIDEIIQSFKGLQKISFCGFHFHIGTQILDEDIILKYFRQTLELKNKIEKQFNIVLPVLIFGGGFGVSYRKEKGINLESLSKNIKKIYKELTDQRTQIIIELGRFLVAESGFYISRVLSKKISRGKTFAILNGGFNHLLRASQANETEARLLLSVKNLSNAGKKKETLTLAGPTCSSRDILAEDIQLSEVRVGDYLCFESAGAYGFKLSPIQFISLPQPVEVFIDS